MKFTEEFKLSTPPQSLPRFSFVGALFKCLHFPCRDSGIRYSPFADRLHSMEMCCAAACLAVFQRD